MADSPTSFRLPADLVAALREVGEETGETMSDLLRRGALMVLGICPDMPRPEGERGRERRMRARAVPGLPHVALPAARLPA